MIFIMRNRIDASKYEKVFKDPKYQNVKHTEKVVVWTAFFMNFLCFYGFQASKQAVLRWLSPTFDIHLNLIELFPLHRSGRLGSNIIDNSGYSRNFIDNSAADSFQNIVRNPGKLRRHEIIRGNAS